MRIQRGKLPGVKPTIFKLREGGTGSSTPDGALTALDAVPASLIDKPGGVLSLDSNRKLKSDVIAGLSVSGVSIDGPTSMSINQSLPFTITDYDSFLTYNIVAIGGSVSRSGDTITYTAPSSAGPSGFTINGKTISVAVGANIVTAPTINNIINGATNINSTINLTTTAFTLSGGSDTHQWTDWQIATDAGFTTIVSQSLSDTVNKLSWTSGTLQPATTYYARVRHKGNALGYSNWSTIVLFTTKSSFLPTVEEAILIANDKISGDAFGCSVSINSDGTRIAIGVRYSDPGGSTWSNAGAVYIYFKSGSSWIQEAKLVATDKASNDEFGISVCLNSDATRVVIGAFNADGGSTDSGKVYIFLRTGTSWTQEAMMQASDKSSTDHFGISVTIDDAANRCMVGSASRGTGQGGVYVFTRSGTSWAQEAIIQADIPQINSYFGNSISTDSTGVRVAIGSYGYAIGGNARGKVFVYIRSGTVWTLEQGFIASDGATSDQFGCSVAIDSTGTRVVVGSNFADNFGTPNSGKTYIFTRSGSSWIQEQILTASDKSSNYSFGYSVSINSDGSKILIGSIGALVDTIPTTGKGYIFTRSGTVWTEGGGIYPATRAAGDQFGTSVSISKDGTKCVIGASAADMGGASDCGKAVVFG